MTAQLFTRSQDVSRLLIFLITALLSFTSRAEINLIFGLYTSDKPTTMVTKFRPFINTLEAQMTHKLKQPVRIKMHISSNYNDGVLALTNGKVDFSRLGPASYITAKNLNADLTLLAIEAKKGKKRFHGIIAVQTDSPITKTEQLVGKRFAFGSEQSTIGRYLSQSYLADHHVLASDLAKYDYLNRHDAVGTSVAAGRYDAGALKEGTFNKLRSKGVLLREIARFPNVTKPWVAKSGLDADIAQALSALLIASNESNALYKNSFSKNGFLAGDDSDYDIIRQSMNDKRFFAKNPTK
ncbi:PhnD/SsuA/transferrin family substrate-binding protein [Moritella sp. F3]|uniref:PhnD/SsuA/transferrin family substrate-binding protein n=1 Tax=Moritella sp. F3 TaxID=2718882 RepID=UPI0018E0E3DC|nr:PhnD/SsuA/transferrin family substrate-binding protein [Moritella sp. F3]GIC76799.1 ABC transporter substrate-binding protein [Moritella sp. F1]GIC80985.1 ABC transporter substrate-binding protein [Moritella sp. F3]